MSKRKENTMMVESREIAGIIVGIIVLGIAVSISYFLGSTGMFALGSGGVIMGLLLGGTLGYAYAAINRRRRYDYTLGIVILGYLLGAYVVEIFIPDGQFLANLATTGSLGWILYLFYGLVIFMLLVASFAFAKRTDLR
jgi:hypothetical protein